MISHRHAVIAALLVATLSQADAAWAAETANGSDAERAAIEARIQALNAELRSLQQELEEIESPPGRGLRDAPWEVRQETVLEEIAERRYLEREASRNPLSITAYRRNYLLPVSYSDKPNEEAFRDISSTVGPDDVELKFQFSAKVNIMEDLFGETGDLFFGYTQRSWWQAYNTDASSPFRETNFEPELFISFDNTWQFLGWTNTHNQVALNHQSNGRSDPLSRSWNRIIVESSFQRGDWAFRLAPHWRIPESDSEDDNPDIEDFMGHGDVTIAHRFDDEEVSLLWRGDPGNGNMGTQVDYSWPLFGNNIRGHVQYYYGYGESLVDFDNRNHRLSLGFSLNPLFSNGGLTP
jgi:phospholipase A1